VQMIASMQTLQVRGIFLSQNCHNWQTKQFPALGKERPDFQTSFVTSGQKQSKQSQTAENETSEANYRYC